MIETLLFFLVITLGIIALCIGGIFIAMIIFMMYAHRKVIQIEESNRGFKE